MGHKETVQEDVNWIKLAHDRMLMADFHYHNNEFWIPEKWKIS
jgi:hypothetical protein